MNVALNTGTSTGGCIIRLRQGKNSKRACEISSLKTVRNTIPSPQVGAVDLVGVFKVIPHRYSVITLQRKQLLWIWESPIWLSIFLVSCRVSVLDKECAPASLAEDISRHIRETLKVSISAADLGDMDLGDSFVGDFGDVGGAIDFGSFF